MYDVRGDESNLSGHHCRAWVRDFICVYFFGGSICVIVDWSIRVIGGRMVYQAHATREAYLLCF